MFNLDRGKTGLTLVLAGVLSHFIVGFLQGQIVVPARAQVVNPGTPTLPPTPSNNDCAKFVVSGGNVQGITTNGGPCTGVNGANPTATAGPSAINGSAATYMRSDAAPAVQEASNSAFGILKCSGTDISCPSAIPGLNAFTGDVTKSSGSLATTVNAINGEPICGTAPSALNVLIWNGTSWCGGSTLQLLGNNNQITISTNSVSGYDSVYLYNSVGGSIGAWYTNNNYMDLEGRGANGLILAGANGGNGILIDPSEGVTLASLASAGVECVQASAVGKLSVTGAACGSGSGAVNSVTGSSGINCSPVTGAVGCSLATVANNTMMVNDSGGVASPVASTPTSFWDTFCASTIGYVWVRISGNWACNSSVAADVRWWGAKCDNSTNDTTAINNAIASGIMHIIIPNNAQNSCLVTTLNQLPVNFTLEGQNKAGGNAGACLSTTAATGNVVTLNSGDSIEDLCISSQSSRTSGALIYANLVGNLTLRNLTLSNFFNGIELNGVGSPAASCPLGGEPCAGASMSDLRLYGGTSSHDCIYIHGTSGGSQGYNTDVSGVQIFCTGASTGSALLAAGLEVTECGDCTFVRFQAIYATVGINLDPGADGNSVTTGGLIQYFACDVCLIDSSNYGFSENVTNGAAIDVAKLTNSWIVSVIGSAIYGVLVQTDTGHSPASVIGETDIVNNTIGGWPYGIVLYDNSNSENTHIAGNSIGGSNQAGIYVGASVNFWRIEDNKLGFVASFSGNNVGLSCSGAVQPSEGIVVGNIFTGNTTNRSCAYTPVINQANLN